jgi:molecular chaperone GrpE
MNTENQTQEEEINQQTETAQTTEGLPQEPQNDKVSKLEEELAEMKDKFLRLSAEFDNFRRRTSKEKIDLISTAEERLILALLPVVDDIERARPSFETVSDVAVLKEGVELIFNKLAKTLENKGLKPLLTKGEVFNPDLHEAITQIPAPSDDLKGKVVDEIEKGYYLNEKLIRVSKVIIGS